MRDILGELGGKTVANQGQQNAQTASRLIVDATRHLSPTGSGTGFLDILQKFKERDTFLPSLIRFIQTKQGK